VSFVVFFQEPRHSNGEALVDGFTSWC